ncbi:MAG: CBS domain-containing protein [Brumimicrobium sp.]|nr:CBS domain-containing protein [Brumimicrobium sp.]
MKISGSIYSDKNRALKDTVLDLVAHQVDLLHVDCNDDVRVFDDISHIRTWCDTPIDLHIITETPEKYFDFLRKHPVEYVTFQYEPLQKKLEIPADIKGQKGLAIVTPTSIAAFDEYADFDFILIMATTPGQSGGVFDAQNFIKIREFKSKYPQKNVHVDGGVNGEVSFILRNMGVHSSVSGSFLFKGASVGQALMDLTKRNLESHFKIKDFMIPLEESPVIPYDNLTFMKVLESIERGKQGCTLLEQNGIFKGIISNADVRRGILNNFEDWKNMSVYQMINPDPITIHAENTVNDMLHLVRKYKFPIMYLPVLDENEKVVGIVSFFNLIKGEI